tara:strand:- start:100276 stop:100584 length:309 start_codon:yes stop_codon:yes gene_type:complete
LPKLLCKVGCRNRNAVMGLPTCTRLPLLPKAIFASSGSCTRQLLDSVTVELIPKVKPSPSQLNAQTGSASGTIHSARIILIIVMFPLTSTTNRSLVERFPAH